MGVPFQEIDVSNDAESRAEMAVRAIAPTSCRAPHPQLLMHGATLARHDPARQLRRGTP